jgi:MFS family permease
MTIKREWITAADRAPLVFFTHALPPGRIHATRARMALSDAGTAPLVTITAAAVAAFLSASQDIVIDASRIETFPQAQQGMATAAYVWRYRVALLLSGAGVIKLADIIGWNGALGLMAAIMALGVLVTLAAPEPAAPQPTNADDLGALQSPGRPLHPQGPQPPAAAGTAGVFFPIPAPSPPPHGKFLLALNGRPQARFLQRLLASCRTDDAAHAPAAATRTNLTPVRPPRSKGRMPPHV